MLNIILLASIFMSYRRGRQLDDFWPTFFYEPGFAVVLLHTLFINDAFEDYLTYPDFLIGWILPVIGCCIVSFGIGHWFSMREFKKERGLD